MTATPVARSGGVRLFAPSAHAETRPARSAPKGSRTVAKRRGGSEAVPRARSADGAVFGCSVPSQLVPDEGPQVDEWFINEALKDVRPEYDGDKRLDDAYDRCVRTPRQSFVEEMDAHATAAMNAAREAEKRAERAGLVSVPTTPTGGCTANMAAALTVSHRDALKAALDAFEVDAKLSRVAKLRRAIGFAARAHAVTENGRRSDVAWMVTLTYRGDNSAWRPTHMTRAMDAFRVWCKRLGVACRYVWVAELQKRGVIHYHVCCWLPRGVRMPKWDVRRTRHSSGAWWPHGMTQRVVARNAVGYLLKYMGKGCGDVLGDFPKGARIYGVGGLDHALRRARRWLGLPKFVQAMSDTQDDWRRAAGGGWTAPDGRHFASEFQSTVVGGVRCLVRVVRHEVDWEPSGPFTWVHRGPCFSS